jgi:hypothetical protein
LSPGGTGFSTLRRSLGAILKAELRLVAIPRSAGASPTNARNYRFEEDGENRLSDWMRSNLAVAVRAVDDPDKVAGELVALLHPPLNLTGD